MTQEQENFYRHSTVIVDVTKDAFLQILDFHLKNKRITLHIFIAGNGHEIYHLCYNMYPCCQCPTGTRAAIKGSKVLHPPQLDILFDKNGCKLSGHNSRSISAPHCCCPVNPNLQLQDLDFTMARLLVVNFTTLVPQGSPERSALDFLVGSRNYSFAHAKEGKISNSEYTKSMREIENSLMVLAKIYGKETETKRILSDIARQPLNATVCLQLQNTLLQQCQIQETMNKFLAIKTLPDCLTKDLCDVTVTEGLNAHFEIWTKEDNISTIWSIDGMDLKDSTKFKIRKTGKVHSLDVMNTCLSDKGLYAVRLNDIERRACLHIIEYFTKHLESVRCVEGSSVEFLCQVIEDSFPGCWYKNEIKVENDEKHEVLHAGKNHKLRIQNCDLSDAGTYSVKINNKFSTTSLSVIGIPNCFPGESFNSKYLSSSRRTSSVGNREDALPVADYSPTLNRQDLRQQYYKYGNDKQSFDGHQDTFHRRNSFVEDVSKDREVTKPRMIRESGISTRKERSDYRGILNCLSGKSFHSSFKRKFSSSSRRTSSVGNREDTVHVADNSTTVNKRDLRQRYDKYGNDQRSFEGHQIPFRRSYSFVAGVSKDREVTKPRMIRSSTRDSRMLPKKDRFDFRGVPNCLPGKSFHSSFNRKFSASSRRTASVGNRKDTMRVADYSTTVNKQDLSQRYDKYGNDKQSFDGHEDRCHRSNSFTEGVSNDREVTKPRMVRNSTPNSWMLQREGRLDYKGAPNALLVKSLHSSFNSKHSSSSRPKSSVGNREDAMHVADYSTRVQRQDSGQRYDKYSNDKRSIHQDTFNRRSSFAESFSNDREVTKPRIIRSTQDSCMIQKEEKLDYKEAQDCLPGESFQSSLNSKYSSSSRRTSSVGSREDTMHVADYSNKQVSQRYDKYGNDKRSLDGHQDTFHGSNSFVGVFDNDREVEKPGMFRSSTPDSRMLSREERFDYREVSNCLPDESFFSSSNSHYSSSSFRKHFIVNNEEVKCEEIHVVALKIEEGDFGFDFIITVGKATGSQVFISKIVPGGAACKGDVRVGDEICSINDNSVTNCTRQKVALLITQSMKTGSLNLVLSRRIPDPGCLCCLCCKPVS